MSDPLAVPPVVPSPELAGSLARTVRARIEGGDLEPEPVPPGQDSPKPAFRLTPPASDRDLLPEILRVLELRLSIEVEAAGLAAQRRTQADLAVLRGAVEALETCNEASGDGAEHDAAFHRAMLNTTRNPYFAEIFEVLGGMIIPRQKLRLGDMAAVDRGRYLRGLAKEHRAIYLAIEAGEVFAAQRAMRTHLGQALDRYRALAAAAG